MSLRTNFDLSAYLVLGPENTLGRPVREVIRAALAGGVTFVQIRSKVASAKDLIAYTAEAAAEIAATGLSDQVALVVDDRLDVVLAAREQGVKVDGLHIGQTDLPIEVCRKYLGPDAILGLSARCLELLDYVKHADLTAVDYLGAGPLHETATKKDCGLDPVTGKQLVRPLAELTKLAQLSPLPVVVGGGVKLADLPALKATGVAGFFVVSAIAGADDVEQASRELVATWG
ncbi:MAG: thiamine phosphate synthase [Lactobacillaceae bacterium]|jgi:thiamine-phosphate diphosphorylase|nr:thiamine phosphate synthase [Lactobacillaceae bacterium]